MSKPYIRNKTLTAGTDLDRTEFPEGAVIACTVAGIVQLKLRGGTLLLVPVAVGFTKIDDLAVIGVVAAGTSATAVVDALFRY
jgi:hypothetical protein